MAKNGIELVPFKRKGGDVQACKMLTDFELGKDKFVVGDYLVQNPNGIFEGAKAEDFEEIFEPAKKSYSKKKNAEQVVEVAEVAETASVG